MSVCSGQSLRSISPRLWTRLRSNLCLGRSGVPALSWARCLWPFRLRTAGFEHQMKRIWPASDSPSAQRSPKPSDRSASGQHLISDRLIRATTYRSALHDSAFQSSIRENVPLTSFGEHSNFQAHAELLLTADIILSDSSRETTRTKTRRNRWKQSSY